MTRFAVLLSVLLFCPSALGQALHLTGNRSGAGLGFAYMTAQEGHVYALSAGVAFADQWDAGVVYGSSIEKWSSSGMGGTYRNEGTISGLYVGFVPAPEGRNDMRVRIGFNGQVVSEAGSSKRMALAGLDFVAARPVGGNAYILPSVGGGIVFPLSHMQPTTVASASLGLGIRGTSGGLLLEPMISYVPSQRSLSRGGGLTIAFAF